MRCKCWAGPPVQLDSPPAPANSDQNKTDVIKLGWIILVALVLLWLLKSQHGISPEMKEQLQDWGHIFKHRARAPVMTVQADSCHIFSLTRRKKAIKRAKNFAQHMPSLHQHQPRCLETHRGNSSGNHSFPPKDPVHCHSSSRKRREMRVCGEKGVCPNYLIYSCAFLNRMIRIISPVGAL